jgi:hypothetical protein
MKLLKLLAAALFALAPTTVIAAQFTYAQPTSGPQTMASFSTGLNSTLAAILSNNSGTTAPAVTGQPAAFQWWVDTSTTPRVLKLYDGTSWLSVGTIDATGHLWGASASTLKLLGSTSGTTIVQPSATASGTLTLPAATDTLVGRATTDTLTNKTLTSPTLVTPALGTPASGTLTNATGLPISTGVSGLGSGVATYLGTPTSANLAAALTDETGTGVAVFGTSPTVATPVLNGLPTGTGVSSAATASTLAARDANANISASSFLAGYATTVTAAGTTTLTVASPQLQYFTGATTQTVTLPVVSTLVLGQSWTVVNNSSGAIAVNSSGANLVLSVAAGNTGIFTVVSTSGTTAASWSSTYISSGAGTGTVTSVTCGAPLTGGTITTTGTCSFPSGTQWGLPYYSASTTVLSTGAGTTTTLLHGNASGAPTWTSLAYADIASGALATSGNYQANAASTLLGPNAVWSAAGTTALTDAATIAVDMSTGINFTVTLAGNRTLGAPSNTKVGQTGVFRISQDATGTRTLAYNAVYKWAGGTACTLTTTASKVDYLFYWVFSSSEILLSCATNVSMLDMPANDNFVRTVVAVG